MAKWLTGNPPANVSYNTYYTDKYIRIRIRTRTSNSTLPTHYTVYDTYKGTEKRDAGKRAGPFDAGVRG